MRRIAVAGYICLDITPGLTGTARLDPGLLIEVGPLSLALGGSVANTGRTLSALGANVGGDPLGEIVRQKLATDDRIDGRLSVVPGTSTSYSLVFEQQGLGRTFWHHVGANREFDGAEIELEGVDVFHLGYPPLLPASEAGKADGNAVLRTIAAQTDLVSPSLDDLTSALRIDASFSIDLVEELADRLLDWGSLPSRSRPANMDSSFAQPDSCSHWPWGRQSTRQQTSPPHVQRPSSPGRARLRLSSTAFHRTSPIYFHELWRDCGPQRHPSLERFVRARDRSPFQPACQPVLRRWRQDLSVPW